MTPPPDGGLVTFFDGAASLGNVAVAGGTATLTTSALSRATHSITAVYSGTASFNPSTSSPVSQEVSHSGTSANIESTTPITLFGQAVTFTATISAEPPGAGLPTGPVTFYIDDIQVGIIPLNALGKASLTTSSLNVGNHIVKIGYPGDTNFNPAAADLFAHTVLQASTVTSIGSSTNPSVFGQAVTFTATVLAVSPAGGTPAGNVTFSIDGSPQAPVALAGGVATLTIASLSSGPHTIAATYGGSASHAASASGNLPQTVNKSATTTSVTSSPNPSTQGSSVTFTASVSPIAPGAGARTGTVSFFDGATAIGTASLNGSGQALITTSALAVGARSITAVYSGDGSFNASTSPAYIHTVNSATTTTALASSANPSVFGQAVTFSATVTASGSPTGTVTFRDGATTIGTATLNGSGVASFTSASLAVGSHNLTAVYNGDATSSGSTSPALSQTVNPAATSAALVSSVNPSALHQPVTFTATVSPTAPGAGAPTGTVTFKDGAATLGTATLNASRQAALTTSSLSGGTRSITAVYNGDASFAASTSAPLAQVVNQSTTTTSLTLSPANIDTYGSSIFSATVTAASGTPTGTVTFRRDGVVVGTVPLSASGTASTSPQSGSVGPHSITATYNGDANFQISTSSTVILTVSRLEVSVSIPVLRSGTPAPGELLTLAATVTGDHGPSGVLTFRDFQTRLGTAPIDAQGTGVLSARLGVGQHYITAAYEGDVDHSPSTSDTFVLMIRGTPTVRLVSSANPSASGAPVTFTATVTGPDGSPAPAGSVSFSDGTASLGTAALNSSGQASFTAPSLSGGEHTIVASYSGDPNYAAAASPALTQSVDRAATVTALSEGVDGTGYFLAANVTPQSGSSPVPGGSVRFEDAADQTVVGTGALVNGSATLRLAAPLPVGRRLRAVYAGDAVYASSASPAATFIAAANAFSFAFAFAPDEILSIFGADFADAPATAPSLPLPETLGGVSVRLVDSSGASHPAKLYFVSGGQINLVLPGDFPAGAARLIVTTARGSATLAIQAAGVAPALASADGSGSGAAAAHLLRVHADGSQDPPIAVSSAPVPFGAATDSLYVVLYGTGFRHAQGRMSCSFNGQSVAAMYAGPHPSYPGLDQANLALPDALRGAGAVSISCVVDGQSTNTVTIALQ